MYFENDIIIYHYENKLANHERYKITENTRKRKVGSLGLAVAMTINQRNCLRFQQGMNANMHVASCYFDSLT